MSSLPVALDAMGGDLAPHATIEGALAASALGIGVLLVGDPDRLAPVLGARSGLTIVSALEVIGMADDPGRALRNKRDASVTRSAELVRDGRASSMVSVGNTGAAFGAAMLRMGRLSGVRRPSAAALLPIPSMPGRRMILSDAGANIAATPDMFEQFAVLAAIAARSILGVDAPAVGILSIGEEFGKGNDLVIEAAERLASSAPLRRVGARFVGNAEGRDIISGRFDVVVTDGFTGNVALKSLEGATAEIASLVRKHLRAAGVDLPGLSAELERTTNPEIHNAAILLGIDGVCIVGHGSSTAVGIQHAIEVAHELASSGLVGAVTAQLSRSSHG